MPDLREQLADKFQEWECCQCEFPRSEWLAVADECIRQMEWARHQERISAISDAMVQDQGLIPAMGGVSGVLTAAPPDWSPPTHV